MTRRKIYPRCRLSDATLYRCMLVGHVFEHCKLKDKRMYLMDYIREVVKNYNPNKYVSDSDDNKDPYIWRTIKPGESMVLPFITSNHTLTPQVSGEHNPDIGRLLIYVRYAELVI